MYGLGVLGEKVTAFTIRVVKACAFLEAHHAQKDIVNQFRRSGTSIGANCSEAVGAQTKADYLTKLHIAYKEALETQHWIEVFHESGDFADDAYQSIQADCVEICKLLSTITKNIRININSGKYKE